MALNERDDEGPWCEVCNRAIREDEEDWPDGVCPKCEGQDAEDQEDQLADPLENEFRARRAAREDKEKADLLDEKCRQEALDDLVRESHDRRQRRERDLFKWIAWVTP
jgi:hypothetical protein